MYTQGNQARQINNLNELNSALLRLKPSISGIALSMLEVKGASPAMLDLVIQTSTLTLYDGMKRTEILAALKPGLTARVQTHPIRYEYDTHGDKHFEGGPAGTKFRGDKNAVNAFLVQKIAPELGRIRRHANGKKQTYYLSDMPRACYELVVR
jgi:hypothetical protein